MIACEHFDRLHIIRLFIRTSIYYCLEFANRHLEESKCKTRKYIKVVHL